MVIVTDGAYIEHPALVIETGVKTQRVGSWNPTSGSWTAWFPNHLIVHDIEAHR